MPRKPAPKPEAHSASSPTLPTGGAPPERPRRGRPRLTAEDVAARIAAYCRRFGVPPSGDALPPFPSGKRETAQHREWMALYKAQQRIHGRAASARGADAARLRELLDAQRGRCAICRKPLGPEEARLDRVPEAATADAVVVHPSCFELLALVRTLGPEALERARQRAR